MPTTQSVNRTDVFTELLPLIDAAGIVAARLTVMPCEGATSDAIEDFEDVVRRFRAKHGDEMADAAVAVVDAAALQPQHN